MRPMECKRAGLSQHKLNQAAQLVGLANGSNEPAKRNHSRSTPPACSSSYSSCGPAATRLLADTFP